MADQSLMENLTGELFQPVRLHYRVLNHPGLERAFEKLAVWSSIRPGSRWVWLYEHEAKTLQFQRSYAEFPKELRPIVIGAFFLRTEKALLLDLRSCERALLAIPFFDTQLPRNLVKLEDAEVVNQLFSLTKANQQLTPDALFDGQVSTVNDPEALMKDLTDKAVAGRGLAEKLKILMEELEITLEQAAAADRTFPRPLRRGWHGRRHAGVQRSARSSPGSTGWATPSTPWATRSSRSARCLE